MRETVNIHSVMLAVLVACISFSITKGCRNEMAIEELQKQVQKAEASP